MSGFYEEVLEGETCVRTAPGARHELICGRLHAAVREALASNSAARLLAARDVVQISPGSLVRPDLAIVTSATGKPWLAAEIVDSHDHQTDTVRKKELYENVRLPRLWMVDPRYDNLEVYHGGPHGLALAGILAGDEVLKEQLLPALTLKIRDLFAAA